MTTNGLRTVFRKFHIVRAGQTLSAIASYYSVSPYLLAKCNALQEEPVCGSVLEIPSVIGNAYYAQIGDTRSLLCGSEREYARKNGEYFYPAMLVII